MSAQLESGAVILEFDPSARSAGMGNTGTAVFWGTFPEFYWNPAFLGHHRGIHYEWSSTLLLPSLSEDLSLRANRLTLGAWGIGVTLSGEPISAAGGTYLDYGENTLRDESGTPYGTYYPYEEADTWGIGVNAFELAENVYGGELRETHPISRFGDVSWGYLSKDVEVFFAPETNLNQEIRGHTTTHDHGLLARVTPYDAIDHEGAWPSLDHAIAPLTGGLRLDLAYGRSWINDSGEIIDFTSGSSDPVVRVERQGFGLRVGLALPSAIESELAARDASWLASALSPMVTVGAGWDWYQETYQQPTGDDEGLELGSNGVEITLFNVFSMRRGSYETWNNFQNPVAVSRDTWGFGLGFHVPGIGGVSFDRAHVELPASDLDDRVPTALGFWVDPVGFVRWFRSDQP